MEKITILAGETKDGELYFLEVEPATEKHDYFSMSGFSVKPIKEEDAEKQCRESLEDGEVWQQAVEAGTTQAGLKEWVDEVLTIDGELAGFDNSLYLEEVEVDGVNWLFESSGCGQHEKEELKRYYLPQVYFKKLMRLWKKYHLKKENPLELAGLLDDIKVEGWTSGEKQEAFIIETIKSIEE